MEKEQYLKRLIGEKLCRTEIGTNTVFAINGETDNGQPAILTLSNVLYFDNYRLHINNPISIIPQDKGLNDLPGCTVTAANERMHQAELVFDNGYRLLIDMRDEVYYDPEAMCLYGPHDFWVVWN